MSFLNWSLKQEMNCSAVGNTERTQRKVRKRNEAGGQKLTVSNGPNDLLEIPLQIRRDADVRSFPEREPIRHHRRPTLPHRDAHHQSAGPSRQHRCVQSRLHARGVVRDVHARGARDFPDARGDVLPERVEHVVGAEPFREGGARGRGFRHDDLCAAAGEQADDQGETDGTGAEDEDGRGGVRGEVREVDGVPGDGYGLDEGW